MIEDRIELNAPSVMKRLLDWEHSDPAGTLAGVRHALRWLAVKAQPHLYVRYRPVIAWLRSQGCGASPDDVLEVGSGSIGVTRFWSHPTTGLDISFDGPQLRYMRKVNGSALALPFADGHFKTVVCLDVLEHLAREDRTTAIAEMVRVAERAVLVGLPCGAEAAEAERWAHELTTRAAASTSERRRGELLRRAWFLEEHAEAGYPTNESIEEAVRIGARRYSTNVTVKSFGNESIWAWKRMFPAIVPLHPWSRPVQFLKELALLPWLLTSRRGGYYRTFFSITKAPARTARGGARRPTRVLMLTENMEVPRDRRVWAEAQALHEAGSTVSVVAPLGPGQPENETIGGIDIHRYRRTESAGGAWGYAREYLSALIGAARICARISRTAGFDVIHAGNPPDIFALLALRYKFAGKRYIFDQHDLTPEVYLSRYDTPRAGLLGILRWLERLSYGTADVVIVPNESYRRVATTRGAVPDDRVFVVRNGPGPDWPPMAPRDVSLKRGRRHLALYVGVIGPQDGADNVVRAAAALKQMGRDDVHFAIIGSGDALPDVERISRELGVEDRVEILGWVDDDIVLARYLATADVCLSPEPSNPLNDVSTFVKVMEYMAAGKPVVAFDLAETRWTAGDAARYTLPGDLPGFAENILGILDHEDVASRMSEVARMRMQLLTWERQKRHLLAAYAAAMAPHAQARRSEQVETQ